MSDGFEGLYAIFGLKRSMEVLGFLVNRGEQRFSDVESEISASSDVTTRALDLLSQRGLIQRQESNPRKVYYSATDRGERFYGLATELEEELQEE